MLLTGMERHHPRSPAAEGMQHLLCFILLESFPWLLSLPEAGHPLGMQPPLVIYPVFSRESGNGTQPAAPGSLC